MAAEPRLDRAEPATPLAKPALDEPAKAAAIAKPAPLAALDCDEPSPVAEEISRQLANLISLPGGRGLKARRDPPAAIGATDRFCAACGDWAGLGWPDGRGGTVWLCEDCEPAQPAPRPAEAACGAQRARSAA